MWNPRGVQDGSSGINGALVYWPCSKSSEVRKELGFATFANVLEALRRGYSASCCADRSDSAVSDELCELLKAFCVIENGALASSETITA